MGTHPPSAADVGGPGRNLASLTPPGRRRSRLGAVQQGPTAVPAPSAPCCPRLPLAAAPGIASGLANQRREARFGNFFPLGPGASPPSYGGARREGVREVRAAGPEDGCGEGVQAAPCTRCHASRNTRMPLLYTSGIYPLLLLPKKRQRCSWSKNPGL